MKGKAISQRKFKIDKNTVTDVIRGTLIAIIVSLVGVLVLALVAKFVDIKESIFLPINQLIKLLSVLIGCLAGIKARERGALKGTLIGLLYAVSAIFIFLIIDNNLVNNFSWIDIATGIVSGAVSGVIAVNVKK